MWHYSRSGSRRSATRNLANTAADLSILDTTSKGRRFHSPLRDAGPPSRSPRSSWSTPDTSSLNTPIEWVPFVDLAPTTTPSDQPKFMTFPAGETEVGGTVLFTVDDVSEPDHSAFGIYFPRAPYAIYWSSLNEYHEGAGGLFRDNSRAVSIAVAEGEDEDEDTSTIEEGETAEFVLTRLGLDKVVIHAQRRYRRPRRLPARQPLEQHPPTGQSRSLSPRVRLPPPCPCPPGTTGATFPTTPSR